MIDLKEFEETIRQQLDKAVNDAINKLMNSGDWASQIKSQAVAQFVRTMHKSMPEEIDDKIRDYIDAVFANFSYTGIDDQASKTELTLMPGVVVAENDFVSKTVEAVHTVKTNDLIVNGGMAGKGIKILTDTITNNVFASVMSSAETTLTESVIEKSKAGINFTNVHIDGSPLIEEGAVLSERIKKSNLIRVGTLNDLTVAGDAVLNDTLTVLRDRIGINTHHPSMSLDVWDEEVQVSIGKHKERTAFIGSNRLQNLEIGVNGKGAITVTDKNLVIIDQLQIGKNLFSHGKTCPGYSGSKGDIVFNTDVSAKNPVFAWMCVGAFNWVALSATVS